MGMWIAGQEPSKRALEGVALTIQLRMHINSKHAWGRSTNKENLKNTHRIDIAGVRGYLYLGTEAECEKELLRLLAKGSG